jgi:molecular chaperone DnaJ
MATTRDYYEILAISRSADEEDIRRSFRRLARQYHPDVCQEEDAHERFKEINEAYQVLCDPEKRRTYDQFGHSGLAGSGGSSGFNGDIFSDIFESFFNMGGMGGTAAGRERSQRGADLQVTVRITLEEATFGCEKEVELRRLETCAVCSGTGAQPGTRPERCPSCNGTGEVRRMQQSFFGRFVSVNVCPRCRGEGQVVTTPCASCRGAGMERVNKRITVTVPAGIEDQMQIQRPAEGDAGSHNGPKGNLFVLVSVQPHKVFQRHGNDLVYELAVNMAQAALGDEMEVPTIDGQTAALKIPAGTQNGRIFRVKGKGVSFLRSRGRGDLQVVAKVTTPTNLSDEQKELLKRLAHTFHDNGKQDEARSILNRVFGRE